MVIRMEERKKQTKTYRFETDVIKHAESNPLIPSFSEWACDRYRKEFMSVESLTRKLEYYSQMADSCRSEIQNLKNQVEELSDYSNFTDVELDWIKNEGVRRVKRATFEGVYKAFVNKFNKVDFNRRQFKLLLERFEK